MLTFQTVCPYGLNDRVGDNFLPLDPLYKRPDYNYFKIELENSFLKQTFVKILTTNFDHNLKDASYFIRVCIKSFKMSFLKHACIDVYHFLSSKIQFLSSRFISKTEMV